jgi:hypothetical protein
MLDGSTVKNEKHQDETQHRFLPALATTKHLCAHEARLKAEECRAMALRVGLVEHKAMRLQVSLWERSNSSTPVAINDLSAAAREAI